MSGVRVARDVVIPESEIRYAFSTSGGPGGQHANKAATRVELTWNLDASGALGPRRKERIRRSLGGRVDSSGTIRVASDRYRSQMRNREDATERFRTLVARALRIRRPRVATTPSRASKERRLAAKRHRAEIKRHRRPPAGD